MSEVRTPSFTALLERVRSRALQEARIMLPARVERYDADRQCVDAQPWIDDVLELPDGSLMREKLQVATNCPVMFPRSGPFAITFPIELGSTVMLAFTSASLDRFLSIGGAVDPEDPRRHTINDAVAFPTGHSFAGVTAPATTAPQDAMVLHGAAIKLGGPAATSPASLHSDMQALADVLDAWTPVATDGGAALKTLLTELINTGWPFGSTTTKVL